MNMSMYEALVPSAIRALRNLTHVLEKIAAHAAERSIDQSVFLNSRLYPDMLPLTAQIQIATDMVKGGAARLAGQEPPRYEDNETSFEELIARIGKTVAYLESFAPAQINGSEERDIVLKMRRGDLHFKGIEYLRSFVLPNLYFHATTAYAIGRHNGVALGKMDFLGKSD